MRKNIRFLSMVAAVLMLAPSFGCADFWNSNFENGIFDSGYSDTETGESSGGTNDGSSNGGVSDGFEDDALQSDTVIQFVQTYDVTFHYNNGKAADVVKTLEGERVLEPKSPILNNYEFTGWYADEACTRIYDFSLPVTAKLSLYAGFESQGKHAVRFVLGDGNADTMYVTNGERVQMPERPTKKYHIFTGWYIDEALTEEYDFSLPVESGLALYAAYRLDGCAVTNEITKNTMKSVVKIYNKCYNQNFFGETGSSSSQGSGYCFHSQSGSNGGTYYYVLTNCHVAYKDPDYAYQKFTVVDYRGKEYQGFLYSNSSKMGDAIAADYDLACLYFTADEAEVQPLEMETSNPELGDDIIALGAPHAQSNAITYGKALRYQTLALSNTNAAESNVKFPVLKADAYCSNGSSGGPALNANLSVVGVVYAGNDSSGTSFIVPIEKVREFLDLYVYT